MAFLCVIIVKESVVVITLRQGQRQDETNELSKLSVAFDIAREI